MKKTQVALAALALVASTAAMADVKVYGNVDAGVLSTGGKTVFFGGGNNATTLMGFKGSEDLGNGLKASFNLETGLDLASGSFTGAPSGGSKQLFNRAANVGLSTENVGITLGNHISIVVLDALVYGGTGVGGDLANVPGVVRLLGGKPGSVNHPGANDNTAGTGGTGFFIPESVILSASGAGFTIKAQTRVNPTRNAANSDYSAVTVGTSLAGINVAVGHQTATYDTAANSYKSTFIAGNTSFGDVRVNGAYSSNSGAADSSTYLLGASMPLVGALSGGLTYAKGPTSLGNQTTFSLNYALSKSTSAYFGYTQFSKDGLGGAIANDPATITAASKSLTAVGLTHSF